MPVATDIAAPGKARGLLAAPAAVAADPVDPVDQVDQVEAAAEVAAGAVADARRLLGDSVRTRCR